MAMHMRRGGQFALLALAGFVAGWVMVHAFADGRSSPAGMNKVESASGDAAKPQEETKERGAKAEFKKLLGKDKDAAPKAPPVSVRVAQVTRKSLAPELAAVGNVIAHESVALSARVSSQITDVKFKAGDDVEKGQVLFVLDSRALQAQLGQARAKLAGDTAQLENLKKDYDRHELGVTKGFSSQAERDAAKAAYENQQALIASDNAEIQNLRVQISYCTLTAPISGRTGTINFTVGNVVRENDSVPLVVINQIKPISVQAALPQNSIDAVRAAMREGTVAAMAVTNSGRAVAGNLEYIDNAIDVTNGMFAARAVFDNDDETLWPGTLVNLTIALGADKPEITVPEVAVQHSQTGDFVYVIGNDNIARKVDIKIIRIQDGQALIGEGLQGDERVATDGMMTIKDGGPVTINDTPEGASPDDESPPEETPGASGLAPASADDTKAAGDSR